MNEENKRVKNHEAKTTIWIWSFFQIMYIALPLFVFVTVYALVKPEWDYIKLKPDWNFVTIIFFSESLRDGLRHAELTGQGAVVQEAGIIASIIMVIMSAIVLGVSLLIDGGFIKISANIMNTFLIMQFGLFITGLLLCGSHKYKLKNAEAVKV